MAVHSKKTITAYNADMLDGYHAEELMGMGPSGNYVISVNGKTGVITLSLEELVALENRINANYNFTKSDQVVIGGKRLELQGITDLNDIYLDTVKVIPTNESYISNIDIDDLWNATEEV